MANNKYQIAIEALNERKQELLRELESLEISINSLLSASSYGSASVSGTLTNASGNSVKQPKAKLNAKINHKTAVLETLDKLGRFAHFREIAEHIIRDKNLDVKPTALSRELSIRTLSLKKKKAIVRFGFGNEARNSFWGKPEWLNSNGSIKRGHEYNTEYVSENIDLEQYDRSELFGQ